METIKILFEDGELGVVVKPAGLVVNRAESVKTATLQDWWMAKLPKNVGEGEFKEKGGVVHRLDKDTSGVMVLAKTEAAYENLKLQFLERQVHKTYLTLVHGKPAEESQIISLPIERHSKNKHKFAIGTDLSRTAVTQYQLMNVYKYQDELVSLLEVKPLTGRTHQIRVHLKHLGLPVVSDPIYGGKRFKQDVKWCPRLFLHAAKLEFKNPTSGKTMEFECELPPELQAVIDRLERVN